MEREKDNYFEVVIMAARLTDRQKKKIVADYAQLGSCNAVAKLNGCSPITRYAAIERRHHERLGVPHALDE